MLVNIIYRAITSDGALVGHGTARIVAAVVFEDVILDERISAPAVNGKICVSGWVE